MPSVETERVAIPRDAYQLLVRQVVVPRRILFGRVPAPALYLSRMDVEDVENVRRLAIADLDPERVDQYEPIDAVAGLDGNLGSQPAPEREAHQRHRLVGPGAEDLQVEVHEIVDRLEVRGPRRIAEARMRRRDDLHVPAEEVEERRVVGNGLEAVQEEQRPAFPPAHDLQFEIADGQTILAQACHGVSARRCPPWLDASVPAHDRSISTRIRRARTMAGARLAHRF